MIHIYFLHKIVSVFHLKLADFRWILTSPWKFNIIHKSFDYRYFEVWHFHSKIAFLCINYVWMFVFPLKASSTCRWSDDGEYWECQMNTTVYIFHNHVECLHTPSDVFLIYCRSYKIYPIMQRIFPSHKNTY